MTQPLEDQMPAAKPASPPRRGVRAILPDVGPLRRHRDFRLLYTGQAVSFLGTMLTAAALPYQAYALTGSPLAVGVIGVVQLVPLLVLAFVGGALADAFDRRKMVRVTEACLAVLSLILLANALLPHPALWVLYAVAGLAAALDALQRPSLDALLPRLVERHELASAGALNQLRGTAGMIGGPLIAGFLIATVGLPGAYGVDAASFVVSLVALGRMRAVPPPPDAEAPSLRGIVEGLRYAISRPELLGTYLVDMVAMFFGMPMALYPALAAYYAAHGAGVAAPVAFGLLASAPAVGAFLAAVTSGWTSRVHRHGLAVILAAGTWGAAIAAAGLSPILWPALAGLAVAGGADAVSGIFRGVIWNQTIPDELRGRLAGIELISYSSGPLLGDLEAAGVATVFTPRISVFAGGALCVVGVGLLALALPAFRRYDDRLHLPEHARAA